MFNLLTKERNSFFLFSVHLKKSIQEIPEKQSTRIEKVRTVYEHVHKIIYLKIPNFSLDNRDHKF